MLHTAIHDGVARLTLARPDRGNALSAELVDRLHEAVLAAIDDRSVHALVLAAEGPNFCTGFDLGDLDSTTDGELLHRFVRIEALLAEVWHAPIRTIALARGRAWGAGADLFAVCDDRIAAEDASFRFPGAGFGLVLGTRRLGLRVGPDAARDWVTQARHVTAAQAQAAGLASAVRPAAELPEDAAAPLPEALGALVRAPAVSRATLAAIRAATRSSAHRDEDLAALVRSAAQPGLVGRIRAYRESLRPASGAKAGGG